ncbi:MAG: response regulator [Thermoplasmata archaeon]
MHKKIKKQKKHISRAERSKRATKPIKIHGAPYVKKSRDTARPKKGGHAGKSKKIKKRSLSKTSKIWKELYRKNADLKKETETRGTSNKDWKELYTKNIDLEKKATSEDTSKIGKMFGEDNAEAGGVANIKKEEGGKEKLKILVIENDDCSVEQTKSAILAANPSYDVEVGKDDADGMEKIASKQFDIILINYRLPHIGGLEFLDKTKDVRRDTPVIMVTDEHNESIAAGAFHRGVSEYVVKSNDYFKNLPSIIESVIAKKSWNVLYSKNVEMETKIADVTTAEGAIEVVKAFQKDLLESVGRLDNSVLVIELHNNEEFNKFSKMASALKNVKIKNVQVLGNTYQVTIWAIPESFNIIR